ncbi:CBS domain-containing membrane protein [Hyphomicrobium sp. 1Nfss2.1]|uniref:HPP family protein n=1 Tax=Hyphomicrobium sp. 1Nfss2.1 TaxID=3413936 RepID=UPI003C7A5E2E
MNPQFLTSRWRDNLRDGIAGCAGLAIMQSLANLADLPIAGVPFACSIILIVAAPQSDTAQPRNVVGGHVLSALSGSTMALLMAPHWWTLPIAIGLAIFAMQVTRTLHPPAGLTAVIAATQSVSWHFVLTPILSGAVVLVLLSCAYLRWVRRVSWPEAWF